MLPPVLDIMPNGCATVATEPELVAPTLAFSTISLQRISKISELFGFVAPVLGAFFATLHQGSTGIGTGPYLVPALDLVVAGILLFVDHGVGPHATTALGTHLRCFAHAGTSSLVTSLPGLTGSTVSFLTETTGM